MFSLRFDKTGLFATLNSTLNSVWPQSKQKDKNDLRQRDLCFLDVETTGALFGIHEIVEIAAIRTSPDASNIHSIWSRRLIPQHPERLSAEAQSFNDFNYRIWLDAGAAIPTAALWLEFADFVSGCVPVCQNPSFDRAFITLTAAAYGVADIKLDYHWIGTESLAWPLFVKGELPELSLQTMCTFLGIAPEPMPHNALQGAKTCLGVYRALMTKYGLTTYEQSPALEHITR